METTPFCVYDPTTMRVLRSGVCQLDNLQAQAGAGEQVVTARPPDWLKPWTVAIVDGRPVFSAVVKEKTLAEKKADMLVRLAARRWEVETGGIELDGVKVATDDRSKLLVADAARRAEADPAFTTRWKAENGWRVLSAAQLIAIRDAVFAHVQHCFEREAVLADAVEAAAMEALPSCESAIAAFWP